jgi:hypothetical protein
MMTMRRIRQTLVAGCRFQTLGGLLLLVGRQESGRGRIIATLAGESRYLSIAHGKRAEESNDLFVAKDSSHER